MPRATTYRISDAISRQVSDPSNGGSATTTERPFMASMDDDHDEDDEPNTMDLEREAEEIAMSGRSLGLPLGVKAEDIPLLLPSLTPCTPRLFPLY